MKFLAYALLGAVLTAGATGCCCSHGCNSCASGYGGGGCSPCGPACAPSYGYAPGGCPGGNCGVGAPGFYPQGAFYGPTDVMTANAMPFGTPVATAPSPYVAQTAMAPLESLPTY